MVWSEHDNNFKALNSELAQKCNRVHAEKSSGIYLGGEGLSFQPVGDFDAEADEMDVDKIDGQTLGGNQSGVVPRIAAAEAAIRRLTAEESMQPTSDREAAISVSTVGHAQQEIHSASSGHSEDRIMDTESCSATGNRYLQVSEDASGVVRGENHNISGGSSDQLDPILALDNSHLKTGLQPERSTELARTQLKANPGDLDASDHVQKETDSKTHQPYDDGIFYVASSLLPDADPALERLSKAQTAVHALTALPMDKAQDTLLTLEKILSNALQHPGVDKFRSIRVNNRTFSHKIGCHPDALSLIKLSGFVEEGYPADPVLKLRREDPGLLWLGLSVVKEGLTRIGLSNQTNECC